MARPTENPLWAESADASDISEPSTERSSGYKPSEDWPNAQANWIFRTVGRYLDWLRDGAPEASVKEAIENNNSGAIVNVDGYDPSLFPGQPRDNASPFATNYFAASMACDGRSLFVYAGNVVDNATKILLVDCDDLSGTTELKTAADSSGWPANANARIETDGTIVVTTWDDAVVAFDAETGAELWTSPTIDATNGVTDLAVDGDKVFALVQATGTLYELNYNTGTIDTSNAAWTADEPRAIVSTGRWLFATTWDSGTTTATLERISRGSLGADATWTAPTWSTEPLENRLATDGARVYVPSASDVRAFDAYDGDSIFTTASDVAPTSRRLAVDERWIYSYTGGSSAAVELIDSTTGEIVDQFDVFNGGSGAGMAIDGLDVFLGYEGNHLYRVVTGKRVASWFRQDTAQYMRPFYKLLLPSS